MKKFVLYFFIISALAIVLIGCGSSADTRDNSSSETISSENSTMSEEEYNILRQIFTSQYRSITATIQQQLSNFNNSTEWWSSVEELENQANSASDSFFANEPKIPESKKEDFANLKNSVAAYQSAFSTINSIKGASSADQQRLLSAAAEQMMYANNVWSQATVATE